MENTGIFLKKEWRIKGRPLNEERKIKDDKQKIMQNKGKLLNKDWRRKGNI